MPRKRMTLLHTEKVFFILEFIIFEIRQREKGGFTFM